MYKAKYNCMHSLIYKGAEAELYKTQYLNLPAVEKVRIQKKYKIKEIDEKIRTTRTKTEVYNILRSEKFIDVPKIYDVDIEKSAITMQFIDGKKLKDYFQKANAPEIKKLTKKIALSVSKLHKNNIIHGDLTTSNMILKDDKIFFIDFGLAQYTRKIEDKAVDLSVFKKMILSTHYDNFDLIWDTFTKTYTEKDVLQHLKTVEKRGRYIAK